MIVLEGKRGKQTGKKGFSSPRLFTSALMRENLIMRKKGIPFTPFLYDPKYTHVPPEKSPAPPQASFSLPFRV